jgi:hypothetical protein
MGGALASVACLPVGLAGALLAAMLSTVAGCGTAAAPSTSLAPVDPAPAGTSVATSRTDPGTSPLLPTAEPARPPAAVLIAADTEAPGALGSWTLDGQGSDSPWLPAAGLAEVTTGSGRVTVRLADGVPIGAWSAQAAPATEPGGQIVTSLGGRDESEPALDAVALGPLPPGRWVVAVRLDRADGRGDATFYWLVAAG